MSIPRAQACDREEGPGGDQHHRRAALPGEGDLGAHAQQPERVGRERHPARRREVQGHGACGIQHRVLVFQTFISFHFISVLLMIVNLLRCAGHADEGFRQGNRVAAGP